MLKQIVISLILAGISSIALAGNFQVKVGGSVLAPSNETKLGATTVVKADNEINFTPSVEYFFGNSGVSTELLLATPFNHDVKINGVKAASLKHLPPTVTIKYNFNNSTRFTPYIGAGATALIPWEEKGVYKVKEEVGPAAQIGFNYQPADAKNWGVYTDVRYAKLSPKVTLDQAGITKFDLDIDPIVYTLGYSYRF